MKFYDEEHKAKYEEFCEKMKYLDCYHHSLAYLLALDRVCRQHTADIFDFDEDKIKLSALHQSYQTGTSLKTTRLAFNLWNGCFDDGAEYTDKDGYQVPLPSRFYSVEQIFSSEYAPFYYEAVKIRFEIE